MLSLHTLRRKKNNWRSLKDLREVLHKCARASEKFMDAMYDDDLSVTQHADLCKEINHKGAKLDQLCRRRNGVPAFR